MATAATAGVKRARTDAPVYCAHLAPKRVRAALPNTVDCATLLSGDGAPAARVELRARALEMLGVSPAALSLLLAAVRGGLAALRALVDLNVAAPGVAAVLADFQTRGASVVDLNISSHVYCMNDKHTVARAFLASHEEHALACHVLEVVVSSVFAQESSVACRVLSGGGVRDVLLADWCRAYGFCSPGANASTPNLVILTAEGGRSFLIPFAS